MTGAGFGMGIVGNFFSLFFRGVATTSGVILGPIALLLQNVFPDMSGYITAFTLFVTHYVGGAISWFSQILPPVTHDLIGVWILFLITYYGVSWTYAGILKIINIYNKLKP